jgi:hypothetical protein
MGVAIAPGTTTLFVDGGMTLYPGNGRGVGASHQTGWTGVVAELINRIILFVREDSLGENTKKKIVENEEVVT